MSDIMPENVHLAPIAPIDVLETVEQVPSRLGQLGHYAGRTISAALFALEFNPITNEGLRLASLGAGRAIGHNPLFATAVYAATTFAIESSGAIGTANLLDTQTDGKVTGSVAKVLGLGSGLLQKLPKMNKPIEATANMTLGVPATMAIKKAQDPERSHADNVRYGLLASAGVTVGTLPMGYAIAEGAYHPNSLTIGVGGVVVGGLYAAFSKARNKLKAKLSANEQTAVSYTVNRVSSEPLGSEDLLDQSVEYYESLTEDHTGPQRLGLAREDVFKVLKSPDTVKAVFADETGNEVHLPFLVPVRDLYWFNTDYLEKQYGTKDIYYYAHGSGTIEANDPRAAAIDEIVSTGGVIIFDTVEQSEKAERGSLSSLLGSTTAYSVEDFRGKFLNQYEAKVTFNGDKDGEFRQTTSIYDEYLRGVQEGSLEYDDQNGPALVDTIEGEEAERIWEFYQAPFAKLSEKHPIGAGYDQEGFKELLRNPDVFKVVYRQDGQITTVSLYVRDLDACPWLNKEYYASEYAEAYQTGNIFVSLGIVSDESKKTSARSLAIMRLSMALLARRQTPIVLAFECGDVSARFMPRIVEFGINHAGSSQVQGISKPKSQLRYHALTKRSA